MSETDRLPWVVFRLKSESFALPIQSIEEMVRLQETVSMPGAPPHVRGLMTLRGHAIPVIDLRLRLGMDSADAEREALVAMLSTREQEHRDWLSELETSVREKRAFRLAIDPHKCAFGRWYDSFQTQDNILQAVLRRFDKPHQAIHGIAQTVAEYAQRDAFDEALHLIERTRNGELATMVQLFASTRQIIRDQRREVVLIVRQASRLYAMAVDAVESVEPLTLKEDLNGVLDADEAHLVACIAQRAKEQQVVMVLQTDGLVSNLGTLPTELPTAQHAAAAD